MPKHGSPTELRVWWLRLARKGSFVLAALSRSRRYPKTAGGVPSGAVVVLDPHREENDPATPSPSRFRELEIAKLVPGFFLASLSKCCCSCASRSSYSRPACSREAWTFSADRCLSTFKLHTSHSAHVSRGSSRALSAVALPSSSSRHSRRATTPTTFGLMDLFSYRRSAFHVEDYTTLIGAR